MFLAALQKKLDVSENYTFTVAKFDVVEGFFLIDCAFLSLHPIWFLDEHFIQHDIIHV